MIEINDITSKVLNDYYELINKLKTVSGHSFTVIDNSPGEPTLSDIEKLTSYSIYKLWSINFSPQFSKSSHIDLIQGTYCYCMMLYLDIEVLVKPGYREPSKAKASLFLAGANPALGFNLGDYNGAFRKGIIAVDYVQAMSPPALCEDKDNTKVNYLKLHDEQLVELHQDISLILQRANNLRILKQ